MGNFLLKFSYTFSTIIVWSTYEQLLTWICYCEYAWIYQSKISFNWLFWLLIWFSSAILLSKIKLLSFNLYTSPREPHHYFNYLLSREVCTNLQTKISANETLIRNLNVQNTKFKNNNIKKHPPQIYSFWKLLE